MAGVVARVGVVAVTATAPVMMSTMSSTMVGVGAWIGAGSTGAFGWIEPS